MTVIDRLIRLQADADSFVSAERTLAALTAELDSVAQRRADAQERVEQLRPSVTLLRKAEVLLDDLLKTPEDLESEARAKACTEDLFKVFDAPPAAPESPAEPEDVAQSDPVVNPASEEPDPSTEPEDAPQPDPVEDAPPVQPDPAGQEEPAAQTDAPAEPSETTAVTTAYRVRAYLAVHPGSTAKDIAEGLQVPQKTVASTVSRMVATAQAETVDNSWPPIYKLKGAEYTPPAAEPEQEEPAEEDSVEEEAAPQTPPTVASPSPKAPAQKQPSETPAGKLRDVADRQAIQSSPPARAPLAPSKVKPVTDAEERAVLAALIARPNGKGSAGLLSSKAKMATSRVTEVLEHLAEQKLVVRPVEGEHVWSRK